jgi:formamidopyrimidine-DNA glycosylase
VPELPEVETVARSLAPLIGRRILTAEFRGLRVLRGADPETMAACLRGRRITGVERYGKFILVALGGGGYLVIHLGMTGRLLLGGPAGKHTHAILTLDRDAVLLYDDSRQFGLLEYSREFPERFKKLGPEPLLRFLTTSMRKGAKASSSSVTASTSAQVSLASAAGPPSAVFWWRSALRTSVRGARHANPKRPPPAPVLPPGLDRTGHDW